MGLSYALATATLFQVFIKVLIGGFRPHFLATCFGGGVRNLDHPRAGGFGNFYGREVCTGNSAQIDEALMSFPSGHACAAFAGFVFLALYINAKFKVFADYHSRHWRLCFFALPILIATLMALSKLIDYWHNWWDILVGAIIGTMFAILVYRQVYTSIWDWRFVTSFLLTGTPKVDTCFRTNHIALHNALQVAPPNPNTPPPPTRYLTAIDQYGWHTNWSYFGSAAEAKEREKQGIMDEERRRQEEREAMTPPETVPLDGIPEGTGGDGMLDLQLASLGGSLHVPSNTASRNVSGGPVTGQARAGTSQLPHRISLSQVRNKEKPIESGSMLTIDSGRQLPSQQPHGHSAYAELFPSWWDTVWNFVEESERKVSGNPECRAFRVFTASKGTESFVMGFRA